MMTPNGCKNSRLPVTITSDTLIDNGHQIDELISYVRADTAATNFSSSNFYVLSIFFYIIIHCIYIYCVHIYLLHLREYFYFIVFSFKCSS